MKNRFFKISILALMCLGTSAFAQKIIIKEKPVTVVKEGSVYVVPTQTDDSDYYYLDVDNTKRVCYKTIQTEPTFSKLKSEPLTVKMSGSTDTITLHCYTYDPEYFTTEETTTETTKETTY